MVRLPARDLGWLLRAEGCPGGGVGDCSCCHGEPRHMTRLVRCQSTVSHHECLTRAVLVKDVRACSNGMPACLPAGPYLGSGVWSGSITVSQQCGGRGVLPQRLPHQAAAPAHGVYLLLVRLLLLVGQTRPPTVVLLVLLVGGPWRVDQLELGHGGQELLEVALRVDVRASRVGRPARGGRQ